MVFLNLDETQNLIKCENYEKIQDTGDFNNIGRQVTKLCLKV